MSNPSFPCEFSASTISGELGKLKLTLTRSERLTPEDADANFCGKRVDLAIRVMPQGTDEDPGQGKLIDAHAELRGTFDIKKLLLSADSVKFGIAFDLDEFAIEDIRSFDKKIGRVEIFSVNEIPPKESDEEADPDQQTLPMTKPAGENDEGATLPITYLAKPVYGLTKNFCEKLEDAIGPTIGHLVLKMRNDPHWERSVKGIGEAGIERLIAAYTRFRQDFPQPEEEIALESEKEQAVETAEALP